MPILKLLVSKAVIVRQVPMGEGEGVSRWEGEREEQGWGGTVDGDAVAEMSVTENLSRIGDGEGGAAAARRSVVLGD